MKKFSEQQIDVLRELINIGVGKGASILNTMLQAHIKLRVPFVQILKRKELVEYMHTLGHEDLAIVNLAFKGEISGSARLVFPTSSASNLVSVFTGEKFGDIDLDSIRVGTLSEIGNIVINAVMGSISNLLHMHFSYSVPNFLEGSLNNIIPAQDNTTETAILLAQTRFDIDTLKIVGDFIVFLEVGYFDKLLEALDSFIAKNEF